MKIGDILYRSNYFGDNQISSQSDTIDNCNTHHKDILVSKIKEMMNCKSTYDLLDIFEMLLNADKIIYGSNSDESLGFISYDNEDIVDSDIFITTNQPFLGVVTTTIHELTHYKDLNNTALRYIQSINSFDMEINAYAKEYEFLEENNYLDDVSISSSQKIIYENAYKLKNNANISNQEKSFMLELLETIGYDKTKLLQPRLVSNKKIELDRQLHFNHCTFDYLKFIK